MPKCRICEKEKNQCDFYKHSQAASGYDSACKECVKSRSRANRAKRIDYYREYDRQRANHPHRVDARKIYSGTEAGKSAHSAAKARWSESNKIKRGANTLVSRAIRKGELEKPDSCEECGKSNCRLEGHHDDYSKPLDVRWLCSKCHREWHKANGPGKNG